jgi:C-terminal processing protease CtpA/Prc
MKMKHIALTGGVLMLCACNVSPTVPPVILTAASTPTPVPTSTLTPSPIPLTEAQQYLSDALDIIQENALNSSKVDWAKLRPKMLHAAKDAKSAADTYNIIQYILQALNDRHSRFLTPAVAANTKNSTTEDYAVPTGKLIEGRLGYVAVFGFGAQSQDELNKYADEIQNVIIDLSQQDVCGWVVDLRFNSGGNMWPMIAGLGTLIGEGKLGTFKNAKGQTTDWSYRDGQSWNGENPLARVSHPEFVLNPDEIPVAVLIGSQTASSGESTALSFRGRPNTKFFGKPSAGLTTSNQGYVLSDGALILLTTAIEVDRTGQEYGASITPDVPTLNPEQDATNWLLEQPSCTK